MIKKTLIGLSLAGLTLGCSSSVEKIETVKMLDAEVVAAQFEAEVIDILPEIKPEYKWKLEGASIQEQLALQAFQDRGITDRMALATLMGNIKHESQFKPDICEGGARVPYEQCHSGGCFRESAQG